MLNIDKKYIEDTYRQYANITKAIIDYVKKKEKISYIYNINWEIKKQKNGDLVIIVGYNTPDVYSDIFHYGDTLSIEIEEIIKEFNSIDKCYGK